MTLIKRMKGAMGSWAGPPVEADVPGNQKALDQGLADWANRLRDTAEKRSDWS